MKTIPLLLAIATLAGCSAANRDEVKVAAPEAFKRLGFEIVGYEGYQFGPHVWPGYGGAYVWYTLRRIPDNGMTFTGSLQKWGDEIHNTAMRSYETSHPR